MSLAAASAERAGLRRLRPRSLPAIDRATDQPDPSAAEHLAIGHVDAVEHDLARARVAVLPAKRLHGDPRRVHRNEETRQRTVSFGIGVGAEDPEAPVGEGAAVGPGLPAAEAPAAPAGVADGMGTPYGQVAGVVGLGPGLAPDLLAGGDCGQEAFLLGRRADLEQGRSQKEDAVLADSFGSPRPVVLLFEDEPLHDPEPPAAVLRGPAHGGPPVREHGRFPGLVGFEPGCGGNRGQGLGGDMSGQPRTGLAPKGLVLGTEGQVHAPANLAHRRVDYQAGGRGITGGARADVANCHRAGISPRTSTRGGEIFAGRAGFSRSPFRRQCSRHTYGRVIGGLKHRRSGYWRGDANCGLLTSIFWEARR